MTINELLVKGRSKIDDAEGPPFLWGTEEFVDAFNRGQNELCEIGIIQGITIPVPTLPATTTFPTDIPINHTINKYAIDSRIIRIKAAFLLTLKQELIVCSKVWMDEHYPYWLMDTGDDIERDTPQYLVDDVETGYVYIYPYLETDVTDNIRLTMTRYPLVQMLTTDLEESPEIPSNYHIDLLDKMMSILYLKQDVRTYRPAAAKIYEKIWNDKVATIKRLFINKQYKTRTVRVHDAFL